MRMCSASSLGTVCRVDSYRVTVDQYSGKKCSDRAFVACEYPHTYGRCASWYVLLRSNANTRIPRTCFN